MNKRQRKEWLKQHNRYFDPRETWSLDWTMAKFVYPRLKKFKEENIGFPHEFKTIDEWNEILDKMLFSFKVLKDDCVDWKSILMIQIGKMKLIKQMKEFKKD